MYENLRDDPTAKLILVDRTRDKGSGRGHPPSGITSATKNLT